MVTKAKELIKLAKDFAKQKGFELSKTDKKLLTSVAEGKDADFISTWDNFRNYQHGFKLYPTIISLKSEKSKKVVYNLLGWLLFGGMLNIWNNPSLRASLVIWLCTDKEAISYLTHRGISINGAKIDGCLDLDFIDLDVPLIFHCCYFSEGVRLNSAKVKLLNFSGSYIAGYYIGSSKYAIFAQSVEVKSFVFLSNGFQAKGEVSFYGATIGGNFSCSKGIFHNPEGNSILAQGAEIKGSVFLDDGFQSKGEVFFYGATIGSNFQANRGIFHNPNGIALIAQGVDIKGSVYLRDGVEVKGGVSFYGATIGGNFSCSKGSFDNPNGHAIVAQDVEIKGSVFLDDGFEAKGEVSFYGATIGGNLNCDGGSFNKPQGNAILAQNAKIKGSVFLDDGFQAKGVVSFHGTIIGGTFSCQNALFNNPQSHAILAQNAEIKGNVFLDDGFQAKGQVYFYTATIGGTLFLPKVKNTQEMTLGLTLAKIHSLSDQEKGWPEKNNLYLDGLVYNSIDNNCPVDSQSRLEWIRLQNLEENFLPQPYEQLAKVLRMSGHEEAATEILIAKQNDRRRYGELKGFRWVLNYILGLTIDHGYRPQKILIGVLLFLILGWGMFFWGESQNLMSPSRIIALVESSSTQKIIDPNYPKFNSFMYSVDAFLPIIDFHQESYWLPNANIKGNVEIPLNYSNIIFYKNAWIGSLLRYYLWFHIFMGWVLTSLGVAGFTGLVRRLE